MYVLKIELTERLWYEILTANKGSRTISREAGLFQGKQDHLKGSRTISREAGLSQEEGKGSDQQERDLEDGAGGRGLRGRDDF